MVVFLNVKQDVENAQALVLPCVPDLKQATSVQQGIHSWSAEHFFNFKVFRVEEGVILTL